MDVLQIAESRAELLHRLSNWGSYSTFDGYHDPRAFAGKLDAEELWDIPRLASMTAELAASRAHAANREFTPVLMEVELEVEVPVHLAGLVDGPGEEVGGPVCGVCLEEMEMEEREGGVVGLRCVFMSFMRELALCAGTTWKNTTWINSSIFQELEDQNVNVTVSICV
ncbi:hypothetical protein PanWU01x14_040260 [Parasponia andersonii]|uniref:Uncharacterized protein n=1 Tax=Parasponia andersonii TaxID=3476 RepID=A0A2P5DR49_PARAD|nr:hypothetical protein PanWU01x14_040260 [Parasponia andersonii]